MKVPKEISMAKRGGAIRAQTHRIKMDGLFKGKKWVVVQQIRMPRGLTFKTCLGKQARYGWMIRDVATGEILLVGNIMFKTLRLDYDIDYKPKKGRPLGAKSKKTMRRDLDTYLDNVRYTNGLVDGL